MLESASVALGGGALSLGATACDGGGTAGEGGSVGSSRPVVPVGRSGMGKRVRAGGVVLASSGVPAPGESGRGGRAATAGRGDGGAWRAVEEVEGFVVVRAVGLGVRLVGTPVERAGCSVGVAAGTAGVSAGRHRTPSPGGGGGVATTVGRFRHLCLGSQLEHSRPASLHSQRVRTSALHFASLVQLQHGAKVSLWRRRWRGLAEATESVEDLFLRMFMVVSGLGAFCVGPWS